MSYSIGLYVKIEGSDLYVQVATPEYSNLTYNCGEMLRKCMDWDFVINENGKTKYYNCFDVIHSIKRGIKELTDNKKEYKKYNPSNGYGSIKWTLDVLTSLRDCILETAENIPMEHLYMNWDR